MSSTKRMRVIGFVVWGLLLLAAVVSATHIVETAHKLGLHGWQAFTAPALIDIVAVIGKLSMAACFTPTFRRSGFRLLMVGGILSLACNVYAGSNLGERAWGVVVVGAFMLLEHHATKAGRESIVLAADEVDPALVAKRSAAGRKAAATKKRNVEAKAKEERKVAAEARKAKAAAPVSPGRVPTSELNAEMALSD
jgi:hypothetical protein